MMRPALLAFVVVTGGCVTTVNPVIFKVDADAPVLPERAEGCAVEIFDENETPPQKSKTFGRIELSWSQSQLTDQGPEGALRTLRSAVCERGGHYVLNLRALPRGFKEGMLYEGDVAVIVDDDGKPLMGISSNSATSKSSAGEATAPASTTAAPAPAPAPATTP